MPERNAEEIFTAFKEHSIAEFFKKNRQMLGYSGKVRSLVTIVHEYVTNNLDACEEAGILPVVKVKVTANGEDRYIVSVGDNGPGIPRNYVGKALATVLAGTKFHRYVQQRGQQGIGAAGCTLFSQMTTGKQISVKSSTGTGKGYSCKISIDTVKNKPIVSDMEDLPNYPRGLYVEGEFADVKYENSDHGIIEYIKRTALSNPHAEISFIDPDGQEHSFPRSVQVMPGRPEPAKPHPLGLYVNDLLEYAHSSQERKVSSFLQENFARVSSGKVAELREIAKTVDFDKDPKQLSWDDAETLIKAFKQVKWIAPESTHIKPIGEDQIRLAMKNIFEPEFMNVVERKTALLKGGIPFIVEAAVSFGGFSGRKTDEGHEATIMRFANRVPLLFDSGTCAITIAAKNVDWKRYNLDVEKMPLSVFVNVSSVHIPYTGVGKESIAQEDEIVEEIRLALMEAARGVQKYVSGKMKAHHEATRYNTIMRYAKQLSLDLSSITSKDQKSLEKAIERLVASKIPKAAVAEEAGPEENGADKEEEEE
jgi:DNA topoisomerase VI subunit B